MNHEVLLAEDSSLRGEAGCVSLRLGATDAAVLARALSLLNEGVVERVNFIFPAKLSALSSV